MIRWEAGVVEAVLEEREGYQRLRVREKKSGKAGTAVHYSDLLGRAEAGDEVWLNTTAVHLSLGTGGVHFVGGWVGRAPVSPPIRGHIMKLRYTPWQIAVRTGEEQGSPHHEALRETDCLEGMPVLIGELHSMLPVAVATWRYLSEADGRFPKMVYIMTDGGALPLAFSRHVHTLRKMNWLDGTVTAGHAFGGDVEAVNVYSALLLARHALKADLVFISMGPGIVGTGTRYGFTGVEQGQIINAVHTLSGIPVAVLRMQQVDTRKRHRGLSHHTAISLSSVALVPAVVPYPRDAWEWLAPLTPGSVHHWIPVDLTAAETAARLKTYPESVATMGRTVEEDPLFFRCVSGAAETAWHLWKDVSAGRGPGEAVARLRSRDV